MTSQKRKYELYTHDFKADPYDTFAAMRRDDPVLQQPGMDGQTMLWFATRYADVERILRDDKVFAPRSAPPYPQLRSARLTDRSDAQQPHAQQRW